MYPRLTRNCSGVGPAQGLNQQASHRLMLQRWALNKGYTPINMKSWEEDTVEDMEARLTGNVFEHS